MVEFLLVWLYTMAFPQMPLWKKATSPTCLSTQYCYICKKQPCIVLEPWYILEVYLLYQLNYITKTSPNVKHYWFYLCSIFSTSSAFSDPLLLLPGSALIFSLTWSITLASDWSPCLQCLVSNIKPIINIKFLKTKADTLSCTSRSPWCSQNESHTA